MRYKIPQRRPAPGADELMAQWFVVIACLAFVACTIFVLTR